MSARGALTGDNPFRPHFLSTNPRVRRAQPDAASADAHVYALRSIWAPREQIMHAEDVADALRRKLRNLVESSPGY